jgi:hypothetical protein
MRSCRPFALSIPVLSILAGCGSGNSEFFASDDSTAGSGGDDENGGRGGTAARGGSGGTNGAVPEVGPPVALAPGAVGLVGVTSDGVVVFRDEEGLRAVAIEGGSVDDVTDNPGSVLIRGPVVFNWADVDWEAGIGELTIWTAEGRSHELGPTLYAEGLIAADANGSAIVYTANADDETADLMIAGSDFEKPETLVEAMGLGSEETCGPSIGFVGERLFVGFCEVGHREGRIERFELVDGEWESTLIADDALPTWSADASGDRILYLTSSYRAVCSYDGVDYPVDASVSRTTLLPDGSMALYTVGDQLRRTELPEVNPVPVVTRGYSQPVRLSPSFEHALYSTTVTYDEGTRRDLLLVPTDGFDETPIELMNEPLASLGRDSMTADGRFVLFFTDMSARGGSLHVVDVNGEERLVLPDVVEVVSAFGSTIVFSDNASDPEIYPVVADLRAIDVAVEEEPRLLEARILDGRNFQLDAGGDRVVYVRSGLDRDETDPERRGVFTIELRRP